jgi:hypothetical protein
MFYRIISHPIPNFSNIEFKNQMNINLQILLFFGILICQNVGLLKAQQDFLADIHKLQVDTQYAYFQYHSPATAQKFKALFDSIDERRVTLFHYGASHIQAEIVTTQARALLSDEFGSAGPGFLFPFSAAKTYSSVNYTTSHYGDWTFAKSFQTSPKIPLGMRGMTVQTADTLAGFSLEFKNPIPEDDYNMIVFFDNNELTPTFAIESGDFYFEVNDSVLASIEGHNHLIIPIKQELQELKLRLLPSQKEEQLFRFYGVSLQKTGNQSLLYQSLGVGAAPFEALIIMEKLKEHTQLIKPDIVLFDFRTNNILPEFKSQMQLFLLKN